MSVYTHFNKIIIINLNIFSKMRILPLSASPRLPLAASSSLSLISLTIGGLGATLGLISPGLAQETTSVGPSGIDALRLHAFPYNLIGRKIAIGQVEIGRPGQFGIDKAASKSPAIALAGVFLRNGPAKENTNVDNHALYVASVMISDRKRLRGVAPGARLYSTAVGSLKTGSQPEECLSAQHIALQNGGDVRAINFSFGETLQRDPRRGALLDGDALLTQCIDWSARVHDVVYAIAGNQGKGGIPIPTDNFNGLNVAFTTRREGVYRKLDVSNLSNATGGVGGRLKGREINLGSRRSISIVAPGRNIFALNSQAREIRVTGTSFAAPHVTATVALLQEYGDRNIRIASKIPTSQPQWRLDARRHQVTKAVLLNSADKVQDGGNGSYLGMSRTIIDKQTLDWTHSDAYREPRIPLHAEMGTGQLNAFRAYQQFSAGQWKPSGTVPAIGWNYDLVKAASSQDYVLPPLQRGSFVAVTLVWDRLVDLRDRNLNGQFDVGENFSDRGLNNLDLYLLNAESNTPVSAICTSISEVDSVEHIFCPVPTTGNYKIRVQFRQQVNVSTQPYGIAWWTVPER